MEPICYIVGAGDSRGMSISPRAEDLVIAADGGYDALCRAGVRVDLAVGDFDSLGFVPDGVELLRHPPEKDDTDTMLAIYIGLERGCRRFIIHGGLGGRFDHSMANVQSLCHIAQRGARGWLWGEGTAVTALCDGRAEFPGKCRGMLSVFALGGSAEGVCERGTKYTLEDAQLSFDYPLGVSNEFTGARAEISVRSGTLGIVWSCTAAELENMVREGLS